MSYTGTCSALSHPFPKRQMLIVWGAKLQNTQPHSTLFIGDATPVMFRAYSWLYLQGSLLTYSGDYMGCWELNQD